MAANHFVAFRISDVPSPYESHTGRVVVTGSAQELGSWNPAEALGLQKQEADGLWHGETSLATHDNSTEVGIEYKYVMMPEDGSGAEPVWEDGSNRGLSVPPNKRVTVAEAWGNRESSQTEEDSGAPEEGEAVADGPAVAFAEDEGYNDGDEPEEVPAEAAPLEVIEAIPAEIPSVESVSPEVPAHVEVLEEAVVEPAEVPPQEAEKPSVTVEDTAVGGDAVEVHAQEAPVPEPIPIPPLDLSMTSPRARTNSLGTKPKLKVTSERAKMWLFPLNGVPIQEEQSQLFSATQMNFSQMCLESLAKGLRPFVAGSLNNPKSHLNFVEGPKGVRLRADAFSSSTPDVATSHPAVLLKYLQKEKAQFLGSSFVFDAHQRLLRAAYGVTTVTTSRSGTPNGTGGLSPRGQMSPITSPVVGTLPQGLVAPDIDGATDVIEDASILLKHLSEKKTYRNNVDIPKYASMALMYALSNVLNFMKVRDSLDQNSLRLEQLNEEPIERRRLYAKDILAQCITNLDRDDVLEAVIDGLACRIKLE